VSGKKQFSSVNPDLRLNRMKSAVKSNLDEPRFTAIAFSESEELTEANYGATKSQLWNHAAMILCKM